MTKEKFLTIRWNNFLSLGLGLPTLIYIVFAFSSSIWLEKSGLVGLAIFGAFFWLVIEYHTTMRFAWIRENSAKYLSTKQSFTHPLSVIRTIYNIAFWVFLLPFFTTMAYSTGFITYALVIFLRFCANLYTNNILNLTPEEHEKYPFRI